MADDLNYDIAIIGAGPAGLAAAIRFRQLCQQNNRDYRVCVLEKGAEVGAHILSGAVLDPAPLTELIPDWKNCDPPIYTYAAQDNFLLLTEKKAFPLPVPPQLKNEGNYIVSMGKLCRWLAKQAEKLGVDIFPGFPATDVLFDDDGDVIGVQTGVMGVDKNGEHKNNYQKGTKIYAKQIMLAEGAHGSLTKHITKEFELDKDCGPQTYGLGLKEVWEVSPEKHELGVVTHTVGWPLNQNTYGGSFIYHLENNHVAVGYVVGLDYKNPYLSPFQEFQRFKMHPKIKSLFEGGKRLSYGARVINEGGLQAIPKLTFPGGVLIGCSAGFVNVPKIKGNHTAMKSGIIAAETIFQSFKNEENKKEITEYETKIKASWIWKELHEARNIRPAFQKGLYAGLANAWIDTYIFRGNAPWTLKNRADHKTLRKKHSCKEIIYPQPDGKVSFDLASSVYLSNTNHIDTQPCHLHLENPDVPIEINYKIYDSPESHYCPAGVYEVLEDNEGHYLQINASNCLHCKACDIKDPTQNITWVPPEGGGGPGYGEM